MFRAQALTAFLSAAFILTGCQAPAKRAGAKLSSLEYFAFNSQDTSSERIDLLLSPSLIDDPYMLLNDRAIVRSHDAPDLALDLFERAANLAPRNERVKILLNRSILIYTEGERSARSATGALPEFTFDAVSAKEALEILNELYRRGHRELAVAILQSNRVNPDWPGYHRVLGLQLYGSGKPSEALEQFKLAVEKNKSDAKAAYHAGFILHRSKQYEASVPYLKTAHEKGDSQAGYYLAKSFYETGNYNEALNTIKRLGSEFHVIELRGDIELALDWKASPERLTSSFSEKQKQSLFMHWYGVSDISDKNKVIRSIQSYD